MVVVAASALGRYWGGYAKKKAENTATREDIGQLIEQVEAVRKATEEIKSEISGGLWDRQKRWEIKRDETIGEALWEYRKLAVEVAAKIHKDDVNIFKANSVQLFKLRSVVPAAVRRDLGIDAMPAIQ